ncbi:DUF4407 domain-containing protein [Streptomyces sp. SS1-1]|uniref:DUF4407 domain-containing protein n=1 Tax=Streptomyces sp. SS1-1 TaxID=2651869 RepID=UPI0012501116|nr:DUF4407 domain-containing protein [Streptomyces sp. SS1-1]KAB2973869.1 DUF4407 domain-containing protein [Streptomyces sp. SS1-1]
MATDTPLRPYDSAPMDDDRSAVRPIPPGTGPAARLRRLIGIREELLAWVPEERTRYTWYGAIVFNTALVGSLSMALALGSFRSDLPLAAVLLVAAVWFWVVLVMDSWLVSSTHGTAVKKWSLGLRLLLSVLLGLFIAEPILFQIFDKEIRQEIAVGNDQKVADYRGMLVACNPTDGASTADRPDCRRYQLKIAGSPAELSQQTASNTSRAKALETQVASINRTLKDKMAAEQRLCGRDNWIFRNGVRDVTITCERAREDSSSYRTTSKIDTYEKQLAALRAEGQTLAEKKNRAAETYQPLLQRAIDTKTRERAADLDTDGILTRAHGLKAVAGADGFALFLTVVLHLLLLGFDALPVLAKFMSGSTMYDTLLGARFEASRRLHSDELQVRHECARMEHGVQRHRVELDTSDRMQTLDHQYRAAQAERTVRERAELDARTERILRARHA